MSKELLRNIYMKIRHINDASVNSFVNATSGYDATGVQFGVLRNIPLEGSITMSELTDKVKCVASNMTTIIRRMEKQELVVTFRNSADKRQTLVSLTQKGIDVRTTMEVAYQSFLFDMYGVLSDEEQEILYSLLAKIEENLNKK
ncbi:MarR family winged helix-turn-helix transcriptional regulator [Clostridium sp. DJ247]|uniref:MarR family winged helix-turn-helix transcriptional regulator n=1 Tax=Clostridium sp. DJ247 TaxID=2726188 RepID=UPI0016252112|nr:MarR family transcriptional regulator [Clostridium sp. DJ247]MBC2582270.1 MarR family transcriptional regulator [Clostridium sp. DJ247]